MTYYRVTGRYYDNGKVEAEIKTYENCQCEMPEAEYQEKPCCDVYHDWFDNLLDAEKFMVETLNA